MTFSKRIVKYVARKAVKEAGSLALGKTSELLAGAPEKIEEIVDRKKDQYLDEALARAEALF
jgi:hypothetical protein